MKLRALLFALAICLSAPEIYSQAVSGRVTDSGMAPLDYAGVALFNTDDSTYVSATVTDSTGSYFIKATGKFRIQVSCLGFLPYESQVLEVINDTLVHDVVLEHDAMLLSNAVVTGEKLTQSTRNDNGNLIYIPKNSSTAAGGTALDILKKTPGVLVDSNGSISLNGNSSVLVILNGKQTYMQKDELSSLLRATPSSSVTSIEIMRNPSARYDAEGSAGIININMDRVRLEGFSMSINNGLSYWRNLRQNTELSLGYSNDKIRFDANYSHTFGNYSMDYGMRRIQNGKEYISPTSDVDKRRSISGNASLEYEISPVHKIGIRADVNTLEGPGTTTTITDIKDATDGTLEQRLFASNDYYMQKGNRYSGNLFYAASPSEDIGYSLDINYAWFDGGSGNMQPNRYEDPSGNILQDNLYKSENSRDIHILAISYDQKHPLWNGRIESGAKYSFVDSNNGYRFYDIKDGIETVDGTQSNDFIYKEQVIAAYVQYNHAIGNKVSVEAGLRGELSISDGILNTISGSGGEQDHRKYFNLFPSLSIDYRINQKNTIALSYSRRIDRPAYQDLNPFEYLLDELSYWKGNPFLIPQKSNTVSFSYTRNKTAVSASYSYLEDYMAQITDTLSTDKVIMTPKNIGKQHRATLSIFQSFNISKWWECSLNITGYYLMNDIAFDIYRHFDNDGFAGIFSMQNTLRLPWKIIMEVNGSFATGHPGASNEYVKPTGYLDIGLGRSFFNRQLSVNIAVTDIFWTSRWDSSSSFSGFSLWNWGKGESRQIKLNIAYRFGESKKSRHQNSFEELDRL